MKRFLSITASLALTAGIFLSKGQFPSAAKPTDASTVAAPLSVDRVVAEGRMIAYPGAEVVVGSEVSGLIVDLRVKEKTHVRKGEVLAELRSDDLLASLAEAKAKQAEAEADIQFFGREVKREQGLLARGVGASQTVDERRHGLDAAVARRAAAIASEARLQAEIAKTKICSPIDGVVTARHVQGGEVIDKGAKIVTVVDLDRVRIEAEVDEFDTAKIKLGMPATITAEGFSHLSWKGRVEEIPDTVGARRIRPEDPGRPVDSRVLAVKVSLDERTPLLMGQRVEVTFQAESASR